VVPKAFVVGFEQILRKAVLSRGRVVFGAIGLLMIFWLLRLSGVV
jgi:hypothetical protein